MALPASVAAGQFNSGSWDIIDSNRSDQRPEDLEIQTKANGDQVLYVTDTSGHAVHSINLSNHRVQTFVSRWATLSTGLYFDITNPNRAYINVQHPSSGVDRLIEISAVPEPASAALMRTGLALLGGGACRRRCV